MKFLLFPVLIFLGISTVLTAQQVNFSQSNPSATSKAELHQAYMEGNVDEVWHDDIKLTQTTSDFYPDFNGMGYFYLENQELDKAKEAFEIYLAMASQDPYAYYSMGEYYVATKEHDKAAQYFDQAAALGMSQAADRAAIAREQQLYRVVEEQKSGWE